MSAQHSIQAHAIHTSQHCTPTTNAPTPTHLDPQQSLTPSYALKLRYFPWFIAAQVSIIEYLLYTIEYYKQVWAL